MAEYLIQSETLDDIADAINAKTGGSSAMTPAQMVTEIGSISGGGGYAEQTYTITSATSLASELWDNYIAPLVGNYPATAMVYVSNYNADDGLSIIKGVLSRISQTGTGVVDAIRVDGYKTQVSLSGTAAHLAVGATLTVKVIST